jgi:hypothetical protein
MHHVWKDINVMLHSQMKHIVVHVKPLEREIKAAAERGHVLL